MNRLVYACWSGTPVHNENSPADLQAAIEGGDGKMLSRAERQPAPRS